jgi:plasmid stability protein
LPGSAQTRFRDQRAWRLPFHLKETGEPPSETWGTFLDSHLGSLASVDFFAVPTATFRVLPVFFVLCHDRCRVVHFNITEFPSAAWTAQQIIEAFHEGRAYASIDSIMAQLIVRDIPQEVVARLKQRAAKRGHSAEAEHREILKQALLSSGTPSLKAMLSAIPEVGRDSDFARPRRLGRRVVL